MDTAEVAFSTYEWVCYPSLFMPIVPLTLNLFNRLFNILMIVRSAYIPLLMPIEGYPFGRIPFLQYVATIYGKGQRII